MVRLKNPANALRGWKERELSQEKSPSQETNLSRDKSLEESSPPPTATSAIITTWSPSSTVKDLARQKDEDHQPNKDLKLITTPIPDLSTFQPIQSSRISKASIITTDSGYSSQGTPDTPVQPLDSDPVKCLQRMTPPFSGGYNGPEPHQPDAHEVEFLPLVILPGAPPPYFGLDDNELPQRVKERCKREMGSERSISEWLDNVDNLSQAICFLQPMQRTASNSTIRSDTRTMDTECSDIFGDDGSIFGDEFSPDATSWDPSGSKIAEIKRRYAEILLDMMSNYVQEALEAPQPNETAMGGGASGGSVPSGGSTPNMSRGKRKRGDRTGALNDGNESGDEEDEDDSQRERPTKRLGRDELAPLRFACPFFKKDPDRFRTCGFSDHENPSRVKQHIQRKHRRPIYCPRCSEAFKTEDERDNHVRESNCPIKPAQQWEGVTADQFRQLSRRTTHKNDRDKWNAIFMILFPGHPLPDSPYLDASLSRDVNFVRAKFLASAPLALRTALENVLPPEIHEQYAAYIEEQVSSAHIGVFEQVFEELQNSKTATGASSPNFLSPFKGRNSHVRDDGRRISFDSAIGHSLSNSPRVKLADHPPQEGMARGISSYDVPHGEIYHHQETRHSNSQSQAGESEPLDLNTIMVNPSSEMDEPLSPRAQPKLLPGDTRTQQTASDTQDTFEYLSTAQDPEMTALSSTLWLETVQNSTSTSDIGWESSDPNSGSRPPALENEIDLMDTVEPLDQEERVWSEAFLSGLFD